eukprot:6185957-Pleurochrysis_carterae.AAC.5
MERCRLVHECPLSHLQAICHRLYKHAFKRKHWLHHNSNFSASSFSCASSPTLKRGLRQAEPGTLLAHLARLDGNCVLQMTRQIHSERTPYSPRFAGPTQLSSVARFRT